MPPSGRVPARLVSSPNVTMDQRLFSFLKPLQWIKGRRSYFEAHTNLQEMLPIFFSAAERPIGAAYPQSPANALRPES
jgi:hypothetical protein